ncbi:MAG: RHS repeat-associated core domain-containing protein, partial [Desulfobacterales bacterium]|nr:RHS repeat-associated core domain-containing protein [Desulfobacterales bacterium]
MRAKPLVGVSFQAAGSLIDCPFRYQGQYEDEEIGLCYNRFRYYSPDMGLYVSQNPIKIKGGLNLFAYTGDINVWIDPYGLAGLQCSLSGNVVDNATGLPPDRLIAYRL